MYEGCIFFSQLIDFQPHKRFRTCVNRYGGNYRIRSLTCYEQFLCMAFAQLTYRESLRDRVLCLRAMHNKLHHVGIQNKVSKSTLADSNEKRDWRIYCDFAQILIIQAGKLYDDDDFGLQLEETVYALDAFTIDLCRSVFPWARFRPTKSRIKVHTLLDLRSNIPSFVTITDAKVHDVNILFELFPEPGSIYVIAPWIISPSLSSEANPTRSCVVCTRHLSINLLVSSVIRRYDQLEQILQCLSRQTEAHQVL